ncbi:venom protease-like [Anthonomus grandis grandis]|uniref:venom protease-like n=1 Tax=Anthonomus grandis grandis TaxID=2921223 RepID=UPI0021657816|nr:venom protease-like [Anthonomus grandis grandis]
MISKIFCITLVIFLSGKSANGQLYEGDECVIQKTNQKGVCTLLAKCPVAMAEVKKRIFPTTCGFQGNEIIVCCQDQNMPDIIANRQPGVISEAMCKEYSKYVWTVELSPTLLVGAEDIKRRDCPFDKLELVVGGQPASRREFPHMVQLGYERDPVKWGACAGSLISDQFVLTAAHCFGDRSLGDPLFARMGLTDVDDPDHVQEFSIVQQIIHPSYQEPAHYHDIALVKLEKKVNLNTWVRPACLHTSSQSPWTNVIATGWGRTEYAGDESTELLRVVLELYNQTWCNRVFKRETGSDKLRNGIVDEQMICAGHSSEIRDTCQGDSGGPLQAYRTGENMSCMYDIIGITSFGKACGLAVNIPGVYTRVSNYLKWIEDNVWPSN